MYVALGSNLGDRSGNVRHALAAMSRLTRTALIASSSLHETAPFGGVPQGPYINAAACLETELTPRELLAELLRIERELGRDRASEKRWGPRTLDLDLLLFGGRVIDEPELKVPHPGMHERLFVLEPLAEIAAGVVHPVLGKAVQDLRDALRSGKTP